MSILSLFSLRPWHQVSCPSKKTWWSSVRSSDPWVAGAQWVRAPVCAARPLPCGRSGCVCWKPPEGGSSGVESWRGSGSSSARRWVLDFPHANPAASGERLAPLRRVHVLSFVHQMDMACERLYKSGLATASGKFFSFFPNSGSHFFFRDPIILSGVHALLLPLHGGSSGNRTQVSELVQQAPSPAEPAPQPSDNSY